MWDVYILKGKAVVSGNPWPFGVLEVMQFIERIPEDYYTFATPAGTKLPKRLAKTLIP